MSARGIAAVLAAALLASACAEQAPAADVTKGQIGAELKEYTVTLTSAQVRAGTVTFLVRNRGGIAHDFIVLKTDSRPDQIAVDAQAQKAKEDGRVGGFQEIAPGQNRNLRLDLQAGHYVIICNVATHFALGMRTELTIN